MTSAPVVPLLFGGLIALSIFRRVRRNIGRQPLRTSRALVSLTFLTVISVMILGTSAREHRLLLDFGGGLMLGGILGFVGLRLTRFENTEQGHFYTPNAYIGIALSTLFIGRIVYRLMLAGNFATGRASPNSFQSPVTLLIFGLIVGYYWVFLIGLVAHGRRNKSALPALRPIDSGKSRPAQ